MPYKYKHREVSQGRLKKKLIEMSNMPRTMLIEDIGMKNCIHKGEFCLSDQKCWGCDLGEECLDIIGRFKSLGADSEMSKIIQKILVARDYILRKLDVARHDRIGCRCESCKWLRELDTVLLEINKADTD